MSRIHTVAAACAAVASIAAAAAAPASAQDVHADTVIHVCGQPELPSVAECADWTFDTAEDGVDTAEGAYNRTARKYVCDVHWILTGETCPPATNAQVPSSRSV